MGGAIIMGFIILAIPLGLTIWVIARLVNNSRRIRDLEDELRRVQMHLHELRWPPRGATSPPPAPAPAAPKAEPTPAPQTAPPPAPAPARPVVVPPFVPPPIPPTIERKPAEPPPIAPAPPPIRPEP